MYVPLIIAHDSLGQNAGKRGRVTTRSSCGSPLDNSCFFLHWWSEVFALGFRSVRGIYLKS